MLSTFNILKGLMISLEVIIFLNWSVGGEASALYYLNGSAGSSRGYAVGRP